MCPRNHHRLTAKKIWRQQQITSKNGTLSICTASTVHKIPKSTFVQHVKGQRGIKSQTMGKFTALPPVVEHNIASNIKTVGFGLFKKEVLEIIHRYVKENNIPTKFKNGIHGYDYFRRFKKDFNLSQKNTTKCGSCKKKKHRSICNSGLL